MMELEQKSKKPGTQNLTAAIWHAAVEGARSHQIVVAEGRFQKPRPALSAVQDESPQPCADPPNCERTLIGHEARLPKAAAQDRAYRE